MKKNPAAVALGKLRAKRLSAAELSEIGRQGGLRGGKARRAALSPLERTQAARHAARARWKKRRAPR